MPKREIGIVYEDSDFKIDDAPLFKLIFDNNLLYIKCNGSRMNICEGNVNDIRKCLLKAINDLNEITTNDNNSKITKCIFKSKSNKDPEFPILEFHWSGNVEHHGGTINDTIDVLISLIDRNLTYNDWIVFSHKTFEEIIEECRENMMRMVDYIKEISEN